jgi:hypothetical protein
MMSRPSSETLRFLFLNTGTKVTDEDEDNDDHDRDEGEENRGPPSGRERFSYEFVGRSQKTQTPPL